MRHSAAQKRGRSTRNAAQHRIQPDRLRCASSSLFDACSRSEHLNAKPLGHQSHCPLLRQATSCLQSSILPCYNLLRVIQRTYQ
jgi:hypothetical protein